MGLGNQLTPAQRNRIIDGHENNIPLTQIVAATSISYLTVKYTWQMRNRRPLAQLDQPRNDRFRKTTIDDDNRLYRHTRINPRISWQEMRDLSSIKRTQIRQRFREIDPHYTHHISKPRPRLTKNNRSLLLKYSADMLFFPQELWNATWFIDECSIQIGSDLRREWVWRHSGEQWLPRYMIEGSLHQDTVMIWAGMSKKDGITWCFADEYYGSNRTLNAEGYRRLLRDILPRIYQLGQPFLQDNARPHIAHLTIQLLEELGIWVLPHPFRSPDFNPIEHMWKKLKELVHMLHPELLVMRGGKKAKKNALKDAIAQAFRVMKEDTDSHLIEHLLKSMPRRMAACNLVHGDNTIY